MFHCRTGGGATPFQAREWRAHSWGAEAAAGSLAGCSLPTCPCLRHDPLLPNLRTPRSPLRPPPRCGSRILLASTRSPARAADSAQLHTDLRPGPGLRLLQLAEARSPLARRLGGSGSWFHTGDGSSRRLDGTAGRAPGLQPTRVPSQSRERRVTGAQPRTRPRHPHLRGPSRGDPGAGVVAMGESPREQEGEAS